jgi:iron complex transport system ATP-binding protein
VSLLVAQKLSIGYGRRIVATDLALSCEAGTVTCLLGPNGIGKTTLFKTLLGLLPAIDGNVFIEGKGLNALTRREIAQHIAYVPQAHTTEFAYTVLDLVLMGRTAYLSTFSAPSKIDHEHAMTALELLGIAELASRDVTRISGGQRQLVFIARALAQQTNIVVMDEPTASLDLGNRIRVLNTVEGLADKGLAVVLSTHEPEQAFAIAHHVAVLGQDSRFITGEVAGILTSDELSALYGVPVMVERTPSGRHVVGPRPAPSGTS